MRGPSALASVGVAVASSTAWAPPAAAHGVGGRADLPLPIWLFADAAGFALAVSFVLLAFLWRRPRLEQAAAGRPLLATAAPVVRLTGAILRAGALALFVLIVAAALTGSDGAASNPAPRWFYVVFWVGLQLLSALAGDGWRILSPFDTLAASASWLRTRRWSPTPEPHEATGGLVWSHWPAIVGLGGFLWLELAYHEPDSPRAIGVAVLTYTVVVLAGAARWGRQWLRTGEGFTVLFGLLAAMAPLTVRDGRLRLRAPFAGLATFEARRGTAAVILVVLGGTTFDGVSRTSFWDDVIGTTTGWERTALNSVGLIWVIGMVALAWVIASRMAASLSDRDPRDPFELVRYLASLVPIALAYAIAHYFSLLFFETQNALAQISDPFADGQNWFGTIDWRADYTALSPDLIAWVQVGAIVIGHVGGVMVAHDRAVSELSGRVALRSQYPFLAVMVAYTIAGLLLLLNA